MNIDERLAALTKGVELLLASQRAHGDAQHVMKAELSGEVADLTGKMAHLMDTMNRLGRIIEIHEGPAIG